MTINISSLEQGNHSTRFYILSANRLPRWWLRSYRMSLIEVVRDTVRDPLKGQSNMEKKGASGRTKRQIFWILGQRGGDQGQRGGAPRYSALRETLYARKSHFTAPLASRRKTKFATVFLRYTSPNENFEYSYPLNLSCSKMWSHLNLNIFTCRCLSLDELLSSNYHHLPMRLFACV